KAVGISSLLFRRGFRAGRLRLSFDISQTHESLLHLLVAIDNYTYLLALLLDHASLPALRLHQPNRGYSQEKEKRNHGKGPSFDPAAQVREIVAELEHSSLQGLAAGEWMEHVG